MGWLSLAGSKGFTDKHECASWRLLFLHAATSCAWCWSWDTALYEAHVMFSLLSQVGIFLCFVSEVCGFQTEEGTEVKNLTVNKYLEWRRFDFFSNKYMCYPAKDHFSWYGHISGMHRFPDNVTTVMMRRNVETAHIKWQHKKSITFLLMTWEDWKCLKSIVQMLMSCTIPFLYSPEKLETCGGKLDFYQKLIR